jgi:hypothetical protein
MSSFNHLPAAVAVTKAASCGEQTAAEQQQQQHFWSWCSS